MKIEGNKQVVIMTMQLKKISRIGTYEKKKDKEDHSRVTISYHLFHSSMKVLLSGTHAVAQDPLKTAQYSTAPCPTATMSMGNRRLRGNAILMA